MAEALTGAGFLVSFALPVTFRSAVGPRATATALGRGRCLVETDAPYLGPDRERRNEPTTALRVTAELAHLRDEPVDAVVAAIRPAYDRADRRRRASDRRGSGEGFGTRLLCRGTAVTDTAQARRKQGGPTRWARSTSTRHGGTAGEPDGSSGAGSSSGIIVAIIVIAALVYFLVLAPGGGTNNGAAMATASDGGVEPVPSGLMVTHHA